MVCCLLFLQTDLESFWKNYVHYIVYTSVMQLHMLPPHLCTHQMVQLYKDPHGKQVFSSVTVATDYNPSVSSGEELEKLRKRVKDLELSLKQAKVRTSADELY